MERHVNPWRVLFKGFLLYLIFELALLQSNFDAGMLSLYRIPALKWERFPFRAEPELEYPALDVGILDTLFASHVISELKTKDEFRVILLGDSATWGAPFPAHESLSGQLNALGLTCGNRHVRVYNLAYPEPSALKDIAILDRALEYRPDLVIWSVTLLTLTTDLVDEHPLFVTEESEIHDLTTRLGVLKNRFPPQSLAQDFANQQVALYRTLRFQSYPFIQLATHPEIPRESAEMGKDLDTDLTFTGLKPPTLHERDLSLDLVNAFHEVAGNVPVIVMNEPIAVIADVPNSDLHYNTYYPRWAYDGYIEYMDTSAVENQWNYLDYWNLFPEEYFADTPLHLTVEGEQVLANLLAPEIAKICVH
jgi:hypothetical protein